MTGHIQKERTLHLVLHMRGEMQLANKTILLDVEASDTKSCYDTGAHFTVTGIARKGEMYE